MKNVLKHVNENLKRMADPTKAIFFPKFFKAGKGEYGEGDKFAGITVPQIRALAGEVYRDISLEETLQILHSEIHEHRLLALVIFTLKFAKSEEEAEKKKIFDLYLRNTKWINNWDLVDSSAHKIVGKFLLDKDRTLLYSLAESKNLWEQRMSIISTFAFIAKGELEDSIQLAEILLNHPHDLIHKCVGWVLREVGKKDQNLLRKFLEKYGAIMPRVMLRYAIEKFSPQEREYFLGLKKD